MGMSEDHCRHGVPHEHETEYCAICMREALRSETEMTDTAKLRARAELLKRYPRLGEEHASEVGEALLLALDVVEAAERITLEKDIAEDVGGYGEEIVDARILGEPILREKLAAFRAAFPRGDGK
jgi:hypothetical protein